MSKSAGYPPAHLARRVGRLPEDRDNVAGYLELGLETRKAIERLLPAQWSWEGARVLDFGCGAGRTLRHFLPEAVRGTFYGCDIHQPSLDWFSERFVPPFHVVKNDEKPPIPLPSESFDLIYAISVFTHISREWSAWMIDLHRLLAPNGLLIATFMGEGMAKRVSGEPWDEDRIGMTVFAPHQGWDAGGPMVLHSPWWIQEHWGRLFEVEALHPSGFGGRAPIFGVHDHGVAVLRKGQRTCSVADLETPNLQDSREFTALSYQVDRLLRWPNGGPEPRAVLRYKPASLLSTVRRRLRWRFG